MGLLGLWRFGPFSDIFPSGSGGDTKSAASGNQNWPETMREREFGDLSKSRAPLVAKLDPILEAYERGAKVISDTDLRLLKVLAGPGSASLEARVTATNLLAALALSRSQTEEAKRLLDRLLEIVPTDTTTLLNRALTYVVAREYKDAKEVASTALRLCQGQSCWVARAILGFIAAEEDDGPNPTKTSKPQLRFLAEIFGLWGWMRSLKNAPKELARTKSTLLLTEAWCSIRIL